MKKKVVVLYDDRIMPNEKIAQVSGNKTYGNILFKQKTIQQRVEECISSREYVLGFYAFCEEDARKKSLEAIAVSNLSTAVVYLYSSFGIKDVQAFEILLDKAQFLNACVRIMVGRKTAGLMFPNIESFQEWVKNSAYLEDEDTMETISGEMFLDLSSFDTFIQYITSGFDARFFNRLEGDQYTVTKSSTNKEKIRNEYNFFYFLPREMQHWFVQPFSYEENQERASYTMERMHMTDLAIQFVHGAIDLEAFDQILQQLFYFLRSRSTRRISAEEYQKKANQMYLEKVMQRLDDLKKSEYFEKMNRMITAGTAYSHIDEIYAHYRYLYDRIHQKFRFEPLSVVSHGDLCFSNLLYQRHANIIRMIDPKGAKTEEDIWMDPWYDLAKLSHSICGRYDFFNSGLYHMEIGKDMALQLHLDFDNQVYVNLFRKYLEENQYSYPVVRLYEASLFLSMLPLHMDNPQKVFGFLLNGIEILREVEECLKD